VGYECKEGGGKSGKPKRGTAFQVVEGWEVEQADFQKKMKGRGGGKGR